MAANRKPKWVVDKERTAKTQANQTIWLFGLHAVRDALENPDRRKIRAVLTKNAADRLANALAGVEIEVEISDPRKFAAPLDPGSVHQGAALEVAPLNWGKVDEVCAPKGRDILVLLDRVSDPHNVGAILRSAEVFGAHAVIAPARHAAPETGALAKTASGALERQPYLRVRNLGDTMEQLKALGYIMLGFEGTAERTLDQALEEVPPGPLAIVLGAEGPGLRERTLELCDYAVRIDPAGSFGSLNVSNAAAVGLYAAARSLGSA